jgi:RNA polymerase sigma-70 factor (ECF subfamily)
VDQRELVDRAVRGDHDAFAVLVRGSIARLDAAARLILRDPELASDAVQECLVRAWRSLPGLRDPDRFDAWLHRLLMHSCFDLLRHRRRRVIEVELDPIDVPFIGDASMDVADRDELDRVMQRLDPEWRAVVVVHYFLGLPLPEVAAVLGIPVGTAKSRLHRSLEVMRQAFDAEAPSEAAELPRGQFA